MMQWVESSLSPTVDQHYAREGQHVVISRDSQMARLLIFSEGLFSVIGCWATSTSLHNPETDFYINGTGYSYLESVSYACLDEDDERWDELYAEITSKHTLAEIDDLNQIWGARLRQTNLKNAFCWRFTPDGTIINTNYAFCTEFNCPHGSMQGKSIYSIINATQHPQVRAYLDSFTPDVPQQKFDYQCGPVDSHWQRMFHSVNLATFNHQRRPVTFDSCGSFLTVFVREPVKSSL